MADIIVYTDGSAKGNPGKGGYGIVIMSGKYRKDISVGYRLTTNNRMELLAVIVALEMIKQPNNNVMIFSDSKYVIDSIEKKWVFGWQKKGFKGKKNVDLWRRFLKIYPLQNVKFTWVKGHAGNVLNERVDSLAVEGAESENLLVDEQYEENDSAKLF
jgi:ribonuclease HI